MVFCKIWYLHVVKSSVLAILQSFLEWLLGSQALQVLVAFCSTTLALQRNLLVQIFQKLWIIKSIFLPFFFILLAPCPITFPLIDFKTMHLQREGEDPFPAFKSWQEDSESGEAQLSPQAGRMTNHPLEEDCHPILSHRSLDFGQSQRFLHDPETLDSSSKALSFVRTRRASFSSKDDKREDKTPYQLVKKLQKKIKQFEEQFEKEKNSKPSYSDIAANPKVLKWMTDLTKLRKQIKDAKQKSSDGEFIPQTRPRSNTLPKSFGSSLDQEDEENGDEMRVVQKEKKPTKEATLELILKRLKEKRVERCLPEDIKKMTKDHLVEEKTSLQKSLLYYESQHGRPVTREERHIVKPLYDRYRLVKQMLTRASITPILGSPSTKRRGQMLQPIIEGETAHFFEEIKEEEEESDGLSADLNDILKSAVQTQSVLSPVENSESDVEDGQEKLTRDLRLSSTRAASMPELLEQLWKARAEKKKLRKTLREFEEEFYQQNGRNVQKEDRVPMLDEYREYKKIKAKLRLLEVLISKQDSSKSI
uniref:FAM13A-like domain-containing protein n=1 Tax=Meleagris gallopavo TaxID=9103 RepID=A0A803YSP8_MELGA